MRNVLFDLDGTLTDPVVGIVRSFQHALRAVCGPSWTDIELQQFIGPPFREVFETLLQTEDPELNERAIRAYRERYGTQGLYENVVYSGIRETLGELRSMGIRLWVVTSKPQIYADRIIEHFQLREFFAGVYGSELSGERSKKAELLRHVLREEHVEPLTACMIGDRRHDIGGARASNVVGLGALWGYGSREELELAGARALIDSPSAIRSAIRGLTPSCG
ncbi:MAG: HAD hydrolase-like protein [Polyangiaceae bacterium]|nr:HAD hydrolase-like protein [Polyangiaceae bacterium]MCE7892079.1 HAD family hydrolase [Sorangiineae bacterium PRO1]MCL4755488.1 HAD hydrolase-like protein [Myxococcales bacterium]